MEFIIFFNPHRNKLGLWFHGMLFISKNRHTSGHWHPEKMVANGWEYIGEWVE